MKNKIQKTLAAVFAACVVGSAYTYTHLTQEVNRAQAAEKEAAIVIDSLTTQNQALINENDKLKTDLQSMQVEKADLEEEIARRQAFTVSRGSVRSIDVEATAYTDGGNTATGFSLYGLSREDAMVIAVDPSVIPLGSQVYVEFEGDWSDYNGVYTASDTGGAINGNIIDVFVGHGNDGEAYSFGRRTAHVSFI